MDIGGVIVMSVSLCLVAPTAAAQKTAAATAYVAATTQEEKNKRQTAEAICPYTHD